MRRVRLPVLAIGVAIFAPALALGQSAASDPLERRIKETGAERARMPMRKVTIVAGAPARPSTAVRLMPEGAVLAGPKLLRARERVGLDLPRVPDQYVVDMVTDNVAPWKVTTVKPREQRDNDPNPTIYRKFERSWGDKPCPRFPYVMIETPGLLRHEFVYSFAALAAPGVYRNLRPTDGAGYKQIWTQVNWGHNNHAIYQSYNSREGTNEIRTGRKPISVWLQVMYEATMRLNGKLMYKCFAGVQANISLNGPKGVDPITGRYHQ